MITFNIRRTEFSTNCINHDEPMGEKIITERFTSDFLYALISPNWLYYTDFNTLTNVHHGTTGGSSTHLPVIPPPPTAAAIPATNTDEASNASDALYEDPPSRPPSPFEEEIVVAMEAFDGLKGDIVEI